MLESNYLTMLLKPTYGKPVDSKQDILDRGLNVIQEWCTWDDGDLDEYEQLFLCADVIIFFIVKGLIINSNLRRGKYIIV